jgi:hypothetical protein
MPKDISKLAIGNESLHEISNDNGVKIRGNVMVSFS